MSDDEPDRNSFEDIARMLSEEVSRAVERLSQIDVDELSRTAAPVDRSEQLFTKFVRYVNAVAAKQYPPAAKKKAVVARNAPKKKPAARR